MPNSKVPQDSPCMWYEGQRRGQSGCHRCFRGAFTPGFIVITLLFVPLESSVTAASEYSLCALKQQHGLRMPVSSVFCEHALEEI